MTEPTPNPSAAPNPGADPPSRPSLEERMEGFGRDVEAAGERIGRQAEAVGHRLANDPSARRAGDTAARVWGLIVLAAGLWFLADVTLALEMPAVPWADIWPLGLILIGVAIVFRGMGRSRA